MSVLTKLTYSECVLDFDLKQLVLKSLILKVCLSLTEAICLSIRFSLSAYVSSKQLSKNVLNLSILNSSYPNLKLHGLNLIVGEYTL